MGGVNPSNMGKNRLIYGAKVKLVNHNTGGKRLHSHDINYELVSDGPCQQEVTAFEGRDDNDWWIVEDVIGDDCCCLDEIQGDLVSEGDVITLRHQTTNQRLHSHIFTYPYEPYQQMVTCFGEKFNCEEGATNDNWRVSN